ncbi:MAG: 2-hydroxyacyl-CoA dehydratase subunit D [Qingshengfaniella sp.]
MNDALAAILAHPEAAGRQHKAAGGIVLGTLGAAAPAEVIRAAGTLPVRLRGDAASGTAQADEWMEPVQEGALRTIFQRLISGDYDWLDALIVPRSSEQLLQFYHLAEHVRQARPDTPLPQIYLFNLLQTPKPRSTRFDRAEIAHLRQMLATLTGRPVTDDAIRAEVRKANAMRRQITALSSARRQGGPAVSGSDVLALSVAGQVMPTDEATALIKQAHDWIRPRTGPQILLWGSSLDNTCLTQTVEDAGAPIVAEDHDWGERVWHHEVAKTDDPIDGLVEHYQYHAPTPRLAVEAEDARFEALLDEVRPNGVILALEANDDTIGWDVPRRVQAAKARGIPSLTLTRLSFFEQSPDTTERVNMFIRSLEETTQ